ncbi:MAG: fumarylacetoacetate hydrolase family protein [Rubrivivax sp.]|nr:fumarylacetoacetate hydrolase family protein [Rubrivivax sp.]
MKTVVGALLNFQDAWAAMESAMREPPHHRPPVHPVLYLKPANTWIGGGQPVLLPDDVPEVEVGATLGLVLGRAAARVREAEALSYVGGYAIVNDVTVPHAAVLRPPMKQKCRDTFCPIGPVVPAARVPDPGALGLRVFVNGELRLSAHTSQLRRSAARLLAEVSEFMTLAAGDMLLVGVPGNAPRVRVGDRMAIEIDGLGRLENAVEREEEVEEAGAAA